MKRMRSKGTWNLRLFRKDVALCGWNLRDLSRASLVSTATLTRFFQGYGTPKTAKRIAMALGHPLDRYDSKKSSRVAA